MTYLEALAKARQQIKDAEKRGGDSWRPLYILGSGKKHRISTEFSSRCVAEVDVFGHVTTAADLRKAMERE